MSNTFQQPYAGFCSLGRGCSASQEELSDQYKCRYCGKQLHGPMSGCSLPLNDFSRGVICKVQPCVAGAPAPPAPAVVQKPAAQAPSAARSAAAGHPEFLWNTQHPKRKRDPSLPKLKRKRYTRKEKDNMVQVLINRPGVRIADVAKDLGVPEGTLRSWYDEYKREKAQAEDQAAYHHVERNVDVANANITLDLNALAAMDRQQSLHHPPIPPAAAATAAAMMHPMVGEQALYPPAGMLHPPHPAKQDLEPAEPAAKKRRQRYSNETKIQVILALETRPSANLKAVAEEFGVAAGTVRGWRDEADKIQKQAMENRRHGAKANPSKDPLKKIWDAILRLFELNSRLPLLEQLDVNVAVVRTIGVQARDIMLNRYKTDPNLLTESEHSSFQKFKASETWARKWAKDHQVMSSKSPMSLIDDAHDRITQLQRIVDGYKNEHVYSMGTCSMFYRILPHRAYITSREGECPQRACKGVKSKDRLTLYICSNETGSDRLPLTCIGRYENPACFQVNAQRSLPYLSQKEALSDAGTFQQWWRSQFLPHVRSRYTNGEKILLLVDTTGPCKADLLRDPTGQVRVEGLPVPPRPNPISGGGQENMKELESEDKKDGFPECQPMGFGVTETIKRRYRYRLLKEVMDAFDERIPRRKVADNSNFAIPSRGLREGGVANICDAMRLLQGIWDDVVDTTITRAWQSSKLRVKSVAEQHLEQKRGTRAFSEKRQTTREKKALVKSLTSFLSKHESRDFKHDEGSTQLEEAIEKLKNCFLYTDGEVIEEKEILETLESWSTLEDYTPLIDLFRNEIKEEMNIAHLVGLKERVEKATPEADEPDDPELDQSQIEINNVKEDELDVDTAMELAGTIKATAVKLFEKGNILGDLAVTLDDASDSIFRTLRKQREEKALKKEMVEYRAARKQAAAPAPNKVALGNTMPSPAPLDDVDLGDLGELTGTNV